MKQLLIALLCFSVFAGSAQEKTKFSVQCINYKIDSTGSTVKDSLGWEYEYLYPEKAVEERLSGNVDATFDISDDCEITNIKVVNGLGEEIDNAAIKIITAMGDQMLRDPKLCSCVATTKRSNNGLYRVWFRLK